MWRLAVAVCLLVTVYAGQWCFDCVFHVLYFFFFFFFLKKDIKLMK